MRSFEQGRGEPSRAIRLRSYGKSEVRHPIMLIDLLCHVSDYHEFLGDKPLILSCSVKLIIILTFPVFMTLPTGCLPSRTMLAYVHDDHYPLCLNLHVYIYSIDLVSRVCIRGSL